MSKPPISLPLKLMTLVLYFVNFATLDFLYILLQQSKKHITAHEILRNTVLAAIPPQAL